MDYDIERIRADFPILGEKVYGKPLVYFDSAASAQKPRVVLDAIQNVYEKHYANIHRGVYKFSELSTAVHDNARETIRKFINAERESEVIFLRNATEGVNLVAQTFGRTRVSAGDEILISTMEHHANIVPWQMLCEQTGATLRVVPITDEGELDMDAFATMLTERVKLVAMVHVSNTLGTINPIEDIIRQAHAQGIPVLVDGAQSVPHFGVDVRALDCDFLVFSGHKTYGPSGVGVLYGKQKHLEAMPPYMGGGDMIDTVTFEKTTYNVPPYKFEAGTPDIAGAVGLGKSLEYMDGIGLENTAAHEHRLLEYATERIQEIKGVRIIGTAKKKAAVISFAVKDIHPHDLGTIVDREGVAIRTGHHCTQPLMQRFGVPATARASFAMYNTIDEIDHFMMALQKAIKLFR